MTRRATRQALFAEVLGTGLLLTTVIGSGIMAERLAGGNAALALLCNTLATVGGLFVLIEVFAPSSGAHFKRCSFERVLVSAPAYFKRRSLMFLNATVLP